MVFCCIISNKGCHNGEHVALYLQVQPNWLPSSNFNWGIICKQFLLSQILSLTIPKLFFPLDIHWCISTLFPFRYCFSHNFSQLLLLLVTFQTCSLLHHLRKSAMGKCEGKGKRRQGKAEGKKEESREAPILSTASPMQITRQAVFQGINRHMSFEMQS